MKAIILHVSLEGSSPLVWRRIRVPQRTPLSAMHRIVQAAMGWENLHPYLFWRGEAPCSEETSGTMAEVLPQDGSTLTYLYDFGQEWMHRIVREASVTLPGSQVVCLEGEGACPAEDGGARARPFSVRSANARLVRVGDLDPVLIGI
ncbi:MAG: plasmid pRiA4b ORF-3 family protein [Candidatus Xenobia bacterium]